MLAGAAPFLSPSERHHAISAGLVAPFHDGDEGAEGVVAPGERRFEGVLGIEAQPGDAAFARLDARHQFTQAAVARRARHERNMGGAVEDLLAFLLRHAPQHGEHFAVARVLAELLQAAENLLFRLVADAASVVNDQVRGIGVFHRDITSRH